MSIPAVFLSLAIGLVIALTLVLGQYVRLELLWRYLIAVNVVTFLAYLYDKVAAPRTWWRVPERTLHVLAIAGGTPAAFVAQRLLRHKTIKGSFRLRFWLIAVIQVALIGAWLALRSRGMLP